MLVLAEFAHLPVPDWSESGLMRAIRSRLDTTAPAAFAMWPPRHFNSATAVFAIDAAAWPSRSGPGSPV
jgi:hypothetical protein